MTKEDRKHRSDCPYTDNLGPACNCETLAPDVIYGLKAAGWTLDPHTGLRKNPAFFRYFGEHVVYVSQVHAGWMHKWQRGPSCTYTESEGFGTLAACLDDLWGQVASIVEQGFVAQRKLFSIYSAVDLARNSD